MKHRSTGIFIIVLAALAVAPRASQQFVALKDAAADRLQATLWSTFLGLHGQGAEVAARRQPVVTRTRPDARPATEIAAAAEKKSGEASGRHRDLSRRAARKDGEPQVEQVAPPDAPEPFIAKFEVPEELFAIDATDERPARIHIPKELPFELDRLIKAVPEGASAAEIRKRTRALESAARRLKVYSLQQDVALIREYRGPRAPRAKAPKDVLRRSPVVAPKIEWERSGAGFGFDFDSQHSEATRHSMQSHSEK